MGGVEQMGEASRQRGANVWVEQAGGWNKWGVRWWWIGKWVKQAGED